MKWFKRVAAVLAVLVVIFVLVGFLLPGRFEVSRSTVVKASSGAVFESISDLSTWPEWTAWNKTRYPDMQVTVDGHPAQVGANYSWEGSTSGKGKLVLLAVDPESGIQFGLDFNDGQSVCNGSITFKSEGDDLRVTWTMGGELGANPINRYFGLLMDGMIGADFETGLRNLKARAEQRDQDN